MNPKLSSDLQSAIHERHGQPFEVEDDAGLTYVVIPKTAFVHLTNLCHEADEATRRELQRLIQQGVDSGPGIPGERVFAELRQVADSFDAPSACCLNSHRTLASICSRSCGASPPP